MPGKPSYVWIVSGLLWFPPALAWAAPPTPTELSQWQRDLDSDEFAVRENATDKLRGAGAAAKEVVYAAAAGDSPEAATRAATILKAWLVDSDAEVNHLALGLIDRLAADANPAVARRAAALKKESGTFIAQTVSKRLIDLGAKLGSTSEDDAEIDGDVRVMREPDYVTIGPEWKGEVGDLALVGKLPTLRRIHFRHLTPDPKALAFLKSDSIERLIFQQSNIEAEHLASLSGLLKLKHFEAPGSLLDDDAALRLAKFESLETLDLDGTLVTAKGLAALAPLPRLTMLRISGTRIRGGDIGALAASASLETLYVMNTNFSYDSLVALAESSSLKKVYLFNTLVIPSDQQRLQHSHGKLKARLEFDNPVAP